MCRVAVDIGGTFTDIVLESPEVRVSTKVLTTHSAPEDGAMRGIEQLLEQSDYSAVDISLVLHGTTLATNALIERKGARTALLTTDGFRDVLEMGYEKRFAQYNLDAKRPPPLVARKLRYAVKERIAANGKIVDKLNEADIKRVAMAMREQKIESVAIGFLHAYAHPQHEKIAAKVLAAELPDVSVCCSNEVCPEMREYERFSTTVANAYIRPLMSGYLHRFQNNLHTAGIDCPCYLMMSGGGLTTLENATRFPIRLVESGPAGGTILAANMADSRNIRAALAFDMGGTTAKICLIDNAQPKRNRHFEIAREYRDMKGSGLPVRIPVIDMIEIGAGGGSIARLDAMQRIHVGPDSAGSDPGPVAYGLGGKAPTVTDANVMLGKLDSAGFAGGSLSLDADTACSTITRVIGKPLGLAHPWPAAGVTDIVEENMANAARVHAIERGKDPSEYTMIAFGGAAPLHAARLAEKLGIDQVIVPAGAGVGSAIGFLRAPVSYQIVRSYRSAIDALKLDSLNALLHSMTKEATAVVKAAADNQTIFFTYTVDMRYLAQGHELAIEFSTPALTPEDLNELRTRFEKQYEAVYGMTLSDAEVECVSWSINASTAANPAQPICAPQVSRTTQSEHCRIAYDSSSGKMLDHQIFHRDTLNIGEQIIGPAIVTEKETTTVVPANFTACVDAGRALVLNLVHVNDAAPTTVKKISQPIAAQSRHAQARLTIQRQVMWTRLISVVEEQAQALLRTAFGSVVREAGDLSAGVYDTQGRMLAQAVTGTPGHVNTMALAVGHFLNVFPIETMHPGDVYVSNDPWLGTGHLFDFVTVTPAFLHKRVVALFASTSHVTDVGGRGFTADALSVFEEGILIPHMKIRSATQLNDELLAIIAANSRNPTEVLGDIRSLIASNDVGVKRLHGMLHEFKLTSLDDLAEHIFTTSTTATRNAIAALPNGTFHAQMTIDGYENPINLQTRLDINHDHIIVDYAGSSPASRYGINSPKCYTDAYTVFGLKCVIAPDTPNNHASLACFEVRAEDGSCVAPLRPSPVTARHVIGQMLPDAVFGCLAQVVPERTPAESAGSIWVLAMSHDSSALLPQEHATTSFNVMNVGLGGVGATSNAPGLNTTAFPSGVGGIPIEITETESPLIYRRKEFLADSSGAGKSPGGLSQVIEIANTQAADFQVSAATWDRFHNPPRGRAGGHSGQAGKAYLASGTPLRGKSTHRIPAGDALVVELPGGGGYGNPHERDRKQVRDELEAGTLTTFTASTIYGYNKKTDLD